MGEMKAETGAAGVHSCAFALARAAAAPWSMWIELIPGGEFRGRDGRGPYQLADAGAVAAASAALKLDAGIPIDYDHAIDFAAPEGRPAPAAGWIKELEARDGALWGRVEWTEHGAAALATKEYRYISPVFEHNAEGAVVRLLRAALTNNPNLYLKAIAARGAGMDNRDSKVSNDAAGYEAVIAVLREVLQLGAEATVEEMVAALRDVAGKKDAGEKESGGSGPKDEAADREAEYVAVEALEQARAELRAVQEREAAERVERTVGAALREGRIVPAQREWALAYCARDAEGFAAFAARQPRLSLGEASVERNAAPAYRGRIEGSASSELGAVERAVCARLGISASAYAARKAARAGAETNL